MKIPIESLEAAGRQLRVNLSSVFITWLPNFPLPAGANKFSHFILGAAADDIVALLKKRKKKFFWWHLPLASWLLFPDDSCRPREILTWLFGFTKGASVLGCFPGIWGRQVAWVLQSEQSRRSTMFGHRHKSCMRGRVSRPSLLTLSQISVSSVLWALLCFHSVFLCMISFDPYNLWGRQVI